jgi:hypothetical protein
MNPSMPRPLATLATVLLLLGSSGRPPLSAQTPATGAQPETKSVFQQLFKPDAPAVSPAPGKPDAPAPGKSDAPAPGKADAPAPGKSDAPAPGKADAPAIANAFGVSILLRQAGRVFAAGTTGSDRIALRNGEAFAVEVQSQRDGFVRVFYQNAKGRLIQIYPNRFSPDGTIRAGEPLVIGGAADPYEIVIEPPLGPESIAALVSTQAFTDEAELRNLFQEKVFIDVTEGKVPDAGVAFAKSVTFVPKDSLIGTALLKTVTVD